MIFIIPKDKDEFNKKLSKEVFTHNKKDITIKIKALEEEYKKE